MTQRMTETRRDVGKEIDAATPSPEVARRAARDIETHAGDEVEGAGEQSAPDKPFPSPAKNMDGKADEPATRTDSAGDESD